MLFHCAVSILLFHNALVVDSQASCRIDTIREEECGTLTVSLTTPLAGGRAALREEMPWQAAIYTKRMQPYMQICGGSLVNPRVVISAAHCFWSDLEKQLPASAFAVAVGKLYRPWNDKMDVNAQRSDILEIRIPPRYHGSITNFQDDLALLVMVSPFKLNAYVQPVCLDFDQSLDRKHLIDGSIGKVAGWGRTGENGKPSPTLQVLNLAAVDVERCYDAIDPIFRPAITSDKICAGNNTRGTAVCMGDSGGGLSFPENSTDGGQRFYLRGVVSTAPKSANENLCNIYTYATFTHVAKHEHFIREVMAAASAPALVVNQATSTSIDDPFAPRISEILSLPSPAAPKPFKPIGIIATQGKSESSPKYTQDESKKRLNQLEKKGSNEQTVKTGGILKDLSVMQPKPQSDTGADAEYTVQIIEEPNAETRPPRPQVDPDVDADYTVKIIEEPVSIVSETKPQSRPDPDAEKDYTVKITEESNSETRPSRPQVDANADADYTVKIIEEPVSIGTKTKPQSSPDPDADKDYTVKIVEEPNTQPQTNTDADAEYTVKITEESPSSENQASSTEAETEQTTEKKPFLSIASQPFLSTGIHIAQSENVTSQQAQSVDHQTRPSSGDQPSQSSWNQLPLSSWKPAAQSKEPSVKPIDTLVQSIENQMPLSHNQQIQVGNPPFISTGSSLPQTTDNKLIQSVGHQPVQPLEYQLPLSTGNPPAQSKDTPASMENPPVQSVGKLPVQDINQQIQVGNPPFISTGSPQTQTTGNQLFLLGHQPVQPSGYQFPLSAGQSIKDPAVQSVGSPLPQNAWNQQILSLGNQPLTTGNHPVQPIEIQVVKAVESSLPQNAGNQPIFIGNHHIQSTRNQAVQTGYHPVKSVEVQPSLSTESQAVDPKQPFPYSYTTPMNPTWNIHSVGSHHHSQHPHGHYQHDYDYHHDHQYHYDHPYHHNHPYHDHKHHETQCDHDYDSWDHYHGQW